MNIEKMKSSIVDASDYVDRACQLAENIDENMAEIREAINWAQREIDALKREMGVFV